MTFTPFDELCMREALRIARLAKNSVSPNPLVGSVVAKDGKILTKGYHEKYGGPHAEVIALKRAGKKASGAVLYITLEPCVHFGKTPPCTEAILRSGISKVVVGVVDPNPLVCGKGVKKLRSSGVKVLVGLLSSEASALNEAFFKFVKKKRPLVVLKSAVSLDGKICTSSGESQWISGKTSRALSMSLRAESDAVMVGSGTVRKDNPWLTLRGKAGSGARQPLRVAVTASGKIPFKSRLLGKGALVATTHRCSLKVRQALWKTGADVEVCREKNGKVDLQDLMVRLASRRVLRVLVEGGGELNASALEQRIVDRVLFFIAPKIIGGRLSRTPVEGEGVKNLLSAYRLKKVKVSRCGEDVVVEGCL